MDQFISFTENRNKIIEDLLPFINKYKIVISLVLITVVISAYGTLQLLTEQYEAKASILVKIGRENTEVPSTVERGGVFTQGVRAEELNSEIQLVSSRHLIELAVDQLGMDAFRFDLPQPKNILQAAKYYIKKSMRWVKAQGQNLLIAVNLKKKLTDREKIILGVESALKVERIKDSDVIGISLRLPSPELSLQVIKAILDVYFDFRFYVRGESDEVRKFFDAQVGNYKQELKKLDDERSNIQKNWNLNSINEQRQLLLKRLDELNKQIDINKTEEAMLRKRQDVMRSVLNRLPEELKKSAVVIPNPSVHFIKERITNLEVQRAQLVSRYTADARPVNDVDVELNTLKDMLKKEESTMTGSVTSELNPLRQNFSEAIEQDDVKILGLNAMTKQMQAQSAAIEKQLKFIDEGEKQLKVIDRDHTIAEQNYMIYTKRREETYISVELDKRRVANVSILTPPVKPIEPVYPRKLLIMGGSIPLGLLFGIAFALLLEYMKDVVSSPHDLTSIAGLPFLGTFRIHRHSKRRFGFIGKGATMASRLIRFWLFWIILLLLPTVTLGQVNTPWTPIGPYGGSIFAIQRDTFDPNVLLAGTYFGGLYKSSNQGMTWEHLASQFSNLPVFSIAFDPVIPGIIYVGTYNGGIYKSLDGGLTWSAMNTGLSDTTIQSVAIDPFDSTIVLAATYSGIFKSIDSGVTWNTTNSFTGINGKYIVFDPQRSGVVYAGTLGQGIFRSIDNGTMWEKYNTCMGDVDVRSISVSGTLNTTLYAATNKGIYKLTVGISDCWEDITYNLPATPIYQAVKNPVNDLLYAVTDSGIYINGTQGNFTNWTLWSEIPSRILLPDGTGTIFHVAALYGSLLASYDSGINWYEINHGIQNLFSGALAGVAINGSSVIFTGSDQGIHLMSDFFNARGVTQWIKGGNIGRSRNITPHPNIPNMLFASSEKGGLWKSSDWGLNWTPSSDGIVPTRIYDLSQSPVAPYTLYAGTSSGLYISNDNGNNWIMGTGNAVPSHIFSVATDPVRAGVTYIGGLGNVVWRTWDNGSTFLPSSQGLPQENVWLLKAARWGNVYAIMSGGKLFSSSDGGVHWFPTSEGVLNKILSIDIDISSPWIIYIGTAGGGVYKSESGGITWKKLDNGLTNPFIFSIAVDPVNSNTIYAGSEGRIYKSTDGALSWSETGAGLPAGAVTHLAVDPANSLIIYASIQYNGVYKSINGGSTWTNISNGLPSTDTITPISIGTTGIQTIFAGTKKGIYISTGGSNVWKSGSNGLTPMIQNIAINPVVPGTMYAGSLLDGIFKSIDGGLSWNCLGLNDLSITQVVLDPVNPDAIYAATSHGIYHSTDAGISWVSLGQQTGYIFSMLTDPGNPNVLYIGGVSGDIYKSTNGGDTWQILSSNLPRWPVFALEMDSASGILYAAVRWGDVYRSFDGGLTWELIRTPAGDTYFISTLEINPNNGILYAGSNGGGIYRSLDRGQVWETINTGLASLYISKIIVDPFQAGTLYASTHDAGIYKSVDGGLTWNASINGLPLMVYSIHADKQNAGVLYAATEQGVYKSIDSALSWTPQLGGIGAVSIYSLQVDAWNPNIVYAGTNGKGIYKSIDGGGTWTTQGTGINNMVIREIVQGISSNNIYAGTLGNGIIKTTNGGISWSDGIDSALLSPNVVSMVINPVNPSVMYAGTSGTGVLKSTDGGITWHAWNTGLDNMFIFTMAIDPVLPENVFVGTTGGGVFVTKNGAQSWLPLNDGLFNKIVTSLAIDPVYHEIIYAGTEGGGVFKNVRSPIP